MRYNNILEKRMKQMGYSIKGLCLLTDISFPTMKEILLVGLNEYEIRGKHAVQRLLFTPDELKILQMIYNKTLDTSVNIEKALLETTALEIKSALETESSEINVSLSGINFSPCLYGRNKYIELKIRNKYTNEYNERSFRIFDEEIYDDIADRQDKTAILKFIEKYI